MELLKITNPAWVAQIALDIEQYCKQAGAPNFNYHGVVTLFQRTAQLGGELCELWVAIDNDEPVGFAHWHVKDIPHVGTVYMDYLFSKSNKRDVARALVGEFVAFGERHNSPWYMYDVMNHSPKLMKHITKLAEEQGFEVAEKPYTPCLARKRIKPQEK
jgi:hypothetical protein